jgi:hypothetical protein
VRPHDRGKVLVNGRVFLLIFLAVEEEKEEEKEAEEEKAAEEEMNTIRKVAEMVMTMRNMCLLQSRRILQCV